MLRGLLTAWTFYRAFCPMELTINLPKVLLIATLRIVEINFWVTKAGRVITKDASILYGILISETFRHSRPAAVVGERLCLGYMGVFIDLVWPRWVCLVSINCLGFYFSL